MSSDRLSDLFQKYSKEIHEEYERNSRIPFLSRIQVETNLRAPDFIKFERRFVIPRDLFEPDHLIIVRPFAESIVLSEFQYIIDALRQASPARCKSKTLPNKDTVDNAVSDLLSLTTPNYMIIPIAFNVELTLASLRTKFRAVPFIEYAKGGEYFNYAGNRLRILWSNKYIKLNEIIIGNSKDSQWLFKSEKHAHDDRLRVRFEVNQEDPDPTLLIQTIFKYVPPMQEKVYVISYPAEMCEVAQHDTRINSDKKGS